MHWIRAGPHLSLSLSHANLVIVASGLPRVALITVESFFVYRSSPRRLIAAPTHAQTPAFLGPWGRQWVRVSRRAGAGAQVWDLRSRKLKMDLPGHADEVYAVDWSPDGSMVASGGKDRIVKLWRS